MTDSSTDDVLPKASGPGGEKVKRRGPLSQSQKVIWTGHCLDPEAPVFNTAWQFDFGQSIDPSAFRTALDKLTERADIFRLVVHSSEGGGPELIDLGHPAGRHQDVSVPDEEMARQWISDAIARPFNLKQENFESALIRIGANQWAWFLNQHHAIVDASTGNILLDAMSRLYEGNDDFALPSFLDYAARQAERLRPDDAAHWQAYSSDARQPRIFGSQVTGGCYRAVKQSLVITQTQAAKLEELIAQPGFRSLSREMSLFNIFLTTFGAWLQRVSGESAVPVGVVAHGRSSVEARKTPGCFVEIFPTVLKSNPDSSFRDLHKECAEKSSATFRKASPGSSSPRALNGFNAVLNFVRARFGAFGGVTPKITWLDNGHIDHHHAVRLNVTNYSESAGMECQFAFNTEVFSPARQRAAMSQFTALLDAFLDDPEALVHAVPLAEDDSAAHALTRTKFNAASVLDVLEAFEKYHFKDPNGVALIDRHGSHSRRLLHARSHSIAVALHQRGVRRGDRVGLHLPRSLDLVASVLACLRIGASFVPLDPTQSPQRLDAIAEQAEMVLILNHETLLDTWMPPVAAQDVTKIGIPEGKTPTSTGTAPGYVIFTSGTTGTPKGVEVSRNSLSRYALWANKEFAGGEPSTWALFSAIGFDLTMTSIFAPLMTGGTIRVYGEDAENQVMAVTDVFSDDKVDVVKLTPAHLQLVLASDVGRCHRIRSLVLGGEDLATALCNEAHKVLGGHLRIFNEYGPTEATVGCMIHEFDPERDRDASVPIGRPARDTAIYVLDRGLNPVATDVKGELFIAGPDRLATGYFNRPDETSSVFVDNPFSEGRMYRSGDLGSVRSDGTILYHGRGDDQLKISGVRIEAGEIRAAAHSIDGIDSCAVSVFDAEAAGKQLCRQCGIPKAQPGNRFVEPNLCQTCKEFSDYSARVESYFGDPDELAQIIRTRAKDRTGDFDCVMLLSGGKDSTYALSRLIDITDRVLVATLDNGFISDGAKENIRIITERLGVEHRYLSTPWMNDIFVDSLKRHANVCQGCFKTIYTLGLHLANEVGAPTIVTGLSRGQLFETRLAPDLFSNGSMTSKEIDAMVLDARRSYHAVPDVAAKKLNCGLFGDSDLLSRIAFVDFYRYDDVSVAEMYRHLEGKVGWSKPMDTGRSTNCLINDVGIHVHQTRRAFHNYALPYSWDVRLGHKTRSQALDELNDDIDTTKVASILDEIGFDEPIVPPNGATSSRLVLYYKSSAGLSSSQVRAELLKKLPREAIPDDFVEISDIPLTANGKVDFDAMPTPDFWRDETSLETETVDDSRLSEQEKLILGTWRRVLGRSGLSAESNFYDAGGDSLAAIKISAELNASGMEVTPQQIFLHQTVSAIAANLQKAEKDRDQKPRKPRQLSSRSSRQLAALFGKKPNG